MDPKAPSNNHFFETSFAVPAAKYDNSAWPARYIRVIVCAECEAERLPNVKAQKVIVVIWSAPSKATLRILMLRIDRHEAANRGATRVKRSRTQATNAMETVSRHIITPYSHMFSASILFSAGAPIDISWFAGSLGNHAISIGAPAENSMLAENM